MVTYVIGAGNTDHAFGDAGDYSIVLIRINLQHYQTRSLDEEACRQITSILMFYRNMKIDVIVRGVYDTEGNGMAHEPADADLIVGHLQQLAELLAPFHDIILVYQGLLIGSWGEMHSSRYLSQENLLRFVKALKPLDIAGIPIAVRKPSQLRTLCEEGNRKSLCLFNDAMFGSSTDLGTFGEKPTPKALRTESWLPSDEIEYMQQVNMNGPYGGEIVQGELPWVPKLVIERLQRLCTTYLSCEWQPEAIEAWKHLPCGVHGEQQQTSLYSYIGAHLGYRLLLKSIFARMHPGKSTIDVHLRVKNTGFAPVWQKIKPEIRMVDTFGSCQAFAANMDMDSFMPGKTVRITCRLPLKSSRLYFALVQEKDERILTPEGSIEEPFGLLIGILE